ncbi:hypothetical protein, partial [Acetobacter tropicalis]
VAQDGRLPSTSKKPGCFMSHPPPIITQGMESQPPIQSQGVFRTLQVATRLISSLDMLAIHDPE